MKRLMILVFMFNITLGYAQPGTDDKVFLNNLLILDPDSDLENMQNWTYADLDIKNIINKEVYICKYQYVNKFGEWTLSIKPSDRCMVLGCDSVSHKLNIERWSIDYNARKRFNFEGDRWSRSTYIIPDETPRNQEVRIEEYRIDGSPRDNWIRVKYDEKKRIIARANRTNEFTHIKYNADNLITSYSTIENFNPKQYIRQKHLKVEYDWLGNDIQSVRIFMLNQSGIGNSSLILIKTIECNIVEKNNEGLWVAMDIVEKDNPTDEKYMQTTMYRLVREFK